MGSECVGCDRGPCYWLTGGMFNDQGGEEEKTTKGAKGREIALI